MGLEVKLEKCGDVSLLTICSTCKAIKVNPASEKSPWIEDLGLVAEYSNGDKNKKLSHGSCPACFKKLYPFLCK